MIIKKIKFFLEFYCREYTVHSVVNKRIIFKSNFRR